MDNDPLIKLLLAQARLEGKIDVMVKTTTTHMNETKSDIENLYNRTLEYATKIATLENQIRTINSDIDNLATNQSGMTSRVVSIISLIIVSIGVIIPALTRMLSPTS